MKVCRESQNLNFIGKYGTNNSYKKALKNIQRNYFYSKPIKMLRIIYLTTVLRFILKYFINVLANLCIFFFLKDI